MRPNYHRLAKMFPGRAREAAFILRPFGPDWKLQIPNGDLEQMARKAVVALGLPWKGVVCLPLNPLPEESSEEKNLVHYESVAHRQQSTFLLELLNLGEREGINFWHDDVKAFVLGKTLRAVIMDRSRHFRRSSGRFGKTTLALRRRRLACHRMLAFLAGEKTTLIGGIVDCFEYKVRLRLIIILMVCLLSFGLRVEKTNRDMLDPLLALYAVGWAPYYIMPNGKLLVFVARQTEGGQTVEASA